MTVLAEIFFRVGIFEHAAEFLAVAAAGSLGIAVVGTLFAFVSGRTRLGELLLPAILLPILFPVLLESVGATEGFLSGDAGRFSHHLRLLIGFDTVYAAAAWLLFEPLLESA